MLWAPWTAVPTLLFVCALLAWWLVEPKTTHLNLIVAIGCALFYWAIVPDVAQSTPAHIYRLSTIIATFLRLDALVLYHTNMLLTGFAFVWLAHRAVQVLRKSVNDLISVLGVEVPDAPDVSLAGIRADAATLNWTRPLPTRPVAKFTIQVNGVNVGDSGNQETAITVTGLKPDHFYNIRVIAVGYNNFQAGSRVIRLRTYSRDGRPQLGDGRLPSNFVPDEQQVASPNDHLDEDGTPRGSAASVETASVPDGSTLSPRDANTNPSVGRRNTLTRKHSPSTASMEPPTKEIVDDYSAQSLQKLGENFESIRKEIEEIQLQIAKEEKEYKEMVEELAEEKKLKKRIQKEKDDMTEKLKREVGSTERAMRSAQQRKTQKEKLLRDRKAERQKLHDDITKWDKDIASMRKRQGCFEKEKEEFQRQADARSEALRQDIAQAQASLAQEEAELKEKGRELKEAEDQRKKLPGGEESEEWREKDAEIRRNWDMRLKELHRRLYAANKRLRLANDYGRVLQTQLAAAQQSGLPFMYNQANSSGVEFDSGAQNQLKRRSRNSNSLSAVVIPSPAQSFAVTDRSYGAAQNFGPSRPPTMPPGFPQGSFMDNHIPFSGSLDEDGIRALTAGAPLSPTATSLLPAGMLDDLLDDDPPSPGSMLPRHDTFGSGMTHEYDAQSPTSSARSPSLMSSPQSSTHHLPFSQYAGDNSDRRSLRGFRGDFGPSSSPIPPAPQTSHRNRFIPWLHRGPKETDEAPALGTLKPSQSQSLPRQTEDDDPAPNKRRISFSSGWNMFNRGAMPPRPDAVETTAPSPRGLASRRLGLGTNTSLGSNIFSERDPNSPRPLSIASSEIPRPSTDSGSIWARSLQPQSRLWPTEDGPWTGSRNPSRRPSLHGSPSQLKTTLADADDEILDDSELLHASPSQVGIIGTKPPKTLSQRLNPAAPMFIGNLFRARGEKEKESDKEAKDHKDKSKTRGKDKETKEENPRKSFASISDIGTTSLDESPSDSRKSRDTFSMDSPSITESRESLNLEPPFSHLPLDHATGAGIKDHESGLRKLLRKGSSSKFSFSSVRGLGGKKGPNSVTSSDRNVSGDRTSFDEFAEDNSAQFLGRSYDSLHSSPSIGPTSGPRSAKDKPVGWGSRFTMKKKTGKEKESLDIERDD
ncbi:putative fibronectin type iii domain-containing protein [Rosellinia necatrix]|uniref:Putative fibronectin type iii domain-containing protein n=1 Tax=Rosellinia necatrix TaxID=77044 RepID=A0A1W2TBV4_ROSNE|nr:putative fibronectin type iii domain-containing protein [Rosellinia necatrix]